MLSSGRSRASRPVLGMGNSLGYAGGGSGAGGIYKDMEGLDSAAFDPGDIGSSNGYRTVRWTGLPSQTPDAVAADGGASHREGAAWRRARQKPMQQLDD